MFEMYPKLSHRTLHGVIHRPLKHPCVGPPSRNKQKPRLAARPASLQVRQDRFTDLILNRIVLNSTAFGSSHGKGLTSPVEIVEPKPRHFAAAQSVDGQEQENCLGSQGYRGSVSNGSQHLLNLRPRRCFRRAVVLGDTRTLNAEGDSGRAPSAHFCVPEKGPQCLALCGDAPRLPSLAPLERQEMIDMVDRNRSKVADLIGEPNKEPLCAGPISRDGCGCQSTILQIIREMTGEFGKSGTWSASQLTVKEKPRSRDTNEDLRRTWNMGVESVRTCVPHPRVSCPHDLFLSHRPQLGQFENPYGV